MSPIDSMTWIGTEKTVEFIRRFENTQSNIMTFHIFFLSAICHVVKCHLLVDWSTYRVNLHAHFATSLHNAHTRRIATATSSYSTTDSLNDVFVISISCRHIYACRNSSILLIQRSVITCWAQRSSFKNSVIVKFVNTMEIDKDHASIMLKRLLENGICRDQIELIADDKLR